MIERSDVIYSFILFNEHLDALDEGHVVNTVGSSFLCETPSILPDAKPRQRKGPDPIARSFLSCSSNAGETGETPRDDRAKEPGNGGGGHVADIGDRSKDAVVRIEHIQSLSGY